MMYFEYSGIDYLYHFNTLKPDDADMQQSTVSSFVLVDQACPVQSHWRQ